MNLLEGLNKIEKKLAKESGSSKFGTQAFGGEKERKKC
jgi:hypothetical protein